MTLTWRLVLLPPLVVKNLPAVRETWVQSLGWEDPLEKGMATHSSIPACEIPWTEEPTVQGVAKESDVTEQLTHTHYYQLETKGIRNFDSIICGATASLSLNLNLESLYF